ncbi:MAG: TRAP transporter permease [Spirochaetales bacterium]|nr:TRAP transporter permease [Spirochaetales bacterium]
MEKNDVEIIENDLKQQSGSQNDLEDEKNLEIEKAFIAKRAEELEISMTGKRVLNPFSLKVVAFIASVLAVFQLYTGGFGLFTGLRQRSIHLGLAMIICFMRYASNRNSKGNIQRKIPFYDYLLSLLAVLTCSYIAINADDILSRAGIVYTIDIIVGAIIFMLIIEATRRAVGNVLVALGVVMLFYCRFGYLFGGIFKHPGFSLKMIVRFMILNDSGVWASPLGVSASYVAMFLLLGAALHKSGVSDILLTIAKGIFGHLVGGPAKMAVVASSMFAMISGSSSSNVATTGIVTIPLMKRTGLSPELAGAVEAAASMGGQITPPVMGAAAFIMAEFLGISYIKVALAAILPAMLYYLGVFSMVHFESVKIHAKGVPKDEIKPWKMYALTHSYVFIPVIALVWMLVIGRTPMSACFISFWLTIGLSWLRKETRIGLKKLYEIFTDAGQTMMFIAIPAALAGIVLGTATLTGLAPALAAFISSISKNNLLLTLLITQVMCLILGMGVPTIANYILMTILTVPVMIQAGVHPLAAHLFCFHFGIMSDLTPPVAITAFTASAISGGKFWPTAGHAVRLAAVAYIVPYFFVFNPVLLLGQQPFSIEVLRVFIMAAIGAWLFGTATAGYMLRKLSILERIIVGTGALLLIHTRLLTDIIGIMILLGVFLMQLLEKYFENKKNKGAV